MSRRTTRFNKRDAVEGAILSALGQLCITWTEAGPLDGWVFLGQWIPVEIKTEDNPLTKGQEEFIEMCKERGRPYYVWRNPNEAIAAVTEWTESRGRR